MMSIPPSHVHEIMSIPQTTSKTSHLSVLVKPWTQSVSIYGQWIRRVWPAPLELETLPLDILLEILKELDWRDVLQLRQVSRTLCSVSKHKSVWAAISRKHEDERCPPSHFFEKQVWSQTASELEEAFLRPRKVDAAWTKSDAVSHHVVKTGMEATARTSHLLPGGRWVLAVDDLASIVYYDLDLPPESLVPRTLVNTTPGAIKNPRFSVDITSSKGPYLTFNLAIATCTCTCTQTTYPLDEGAEYRKIQCQTCPGHLQVVRVEPKFDEGGRIVGLSSSLLSSFETEPTRSLGDLHLSGPYVGYHPFGYGGPLGLVPGYCVVEWEQANGRGRSFERRWVDGGRDDRDVLFVPGGLVVVVSLFQIRLLDIKLLPLSTMERCPQPHGNTETPVGQLWSQRFDFQISCYTDLCEVPGGFSFSILQWRKKERVIHAVMIANNNPDLAPVTTQLCCLPAGEEIRGPRSCDHSKFVEVAKENHMHPAIVRHGRFIPPRSYSFCEKPFNKAQCMDIMVPPKLFDMVLINRYPHSSFDGLSGRTLVSDSPGDWVIFSLV